MELQIELKIFKNVAIDILGIPDGIERRKKKKKISEKHHLHIFFFLTWGENIQTHKIATTSDDCQQVASKPLCKTCKFEPTFQIACSKLQSHPLILRAASTPKQASERDYCICLRASRTLPTLPFEEKHPCHLRKDDCIDAYCTHPDHLFTHSFSPPCKRQPFPASLTFRSRTKLCHALPTKMIAAECAFHVIATTVLLNAGVALWTLARDGRNQLIVQRRVPSALLFCPFSKHAARVGTMVGFHTTSKAKGHSTTASHPLVLAFQNLVQHNCVCAIRSRTPANQLVVVNKGLNKSFPKTILY